MAMDDGPADRPDLKSGEAPSTTAADGQPRLPEAAAGDRGRGFLGKTLGVLLGTEKIILRVAALIGAIVVIVGAVALLSHHKAPPEAREASFLEANVQPGVLLEQYEDENSTLEADIQAAGSSSGVRREASLVAFTTTAATTPPTAAVVSPATGFSSPKAESKEAATLSQEARIKQTQAQDEVEAQKEEARDRQAGAIEEPQTNEPRTTQRENARLQRAGQLQQQAKTETEDARLKSSEAEKLKQEEEHPNSVPKQPSSPQRLHQAGSAEVAVGTAPSREEVEAVIRKSGVPLPANCGESCAIGPVIGKALSEYAANTDEAAREVASIFHDSRQGVFGHKRQPLGVAVHFSVDLVGYAGRLLLIEWSLCSTQTGRPLPREWLRNVPAEEVRPTIDRLKHSGNFWVPLPPKRGRYYLRLRVFDGGSEVVQTQTHIFR
ncbi:MAG TPA: hypothetical protein VH061_15810 [Solirubrobacteraceae bacterium]|jgi:hypothetical protein|nr:hypothetical protein [Solirubrobacteraceae bacterium]